MAVYCFKAFHSRIDFAYNTNDSLFSKWCKSRESHCLRNIRVKLDQAQDVLSLSKRNPPELGQDL